MEKCFLPRLFGKYAHNLQAPIWTLGEALASSTAGSWCRRFHPSCAAPGAGYLLCAQHIHIIPHHLWSAHSAPLHCDFYFVGFHLTNDLLLLHLYVSELRCLVGYKVERTIQATVPRQDSVRGDTWDSSAVSRVWWGQVFLRSLIRSHQFSLSQDEEVSRLSSSGFSRNAACSCWASVWCKQLSLHWSKGGRQLHVRGRSGPLPSDYIVIFHKSIYQQLLQPSTTKEQIFFLQIGVNVALEQHYVLVNGSFSQ